MHVFPEIDVSCSKLVQTERWELILQLRDRVQKAIEKARTEDKIIRDSLEAALSLQLTNDHFQLLKENTEMLQQILVVSSVEISQGDDETISISKFSGEKCPRCWQWFSGKSPEQTFPELCPRCSAVVKEQGLDA